MESRPPNDGWATASTSGTLSPEEVATYRKQGFLAITDFASAEEMTNMRARAEKIVDEFEYDRASVFSTTDQKLTTDDYFLDSANGISCFFEEKAHDERGNLCVPKALAINKIGHALHDYDDVFRAFSRSEKVANLMKSLELPNPTPVQSMYIFKQPSIGGEVVPHQDSTFLNRSRRVRRHLARPRRLHAGQRMPPRRTRHLR